jgi:hypothetical protein
VHRTTDRGHSWETLSPDLTKNETEKQGPAGGPVSKDGTTVEFYNTIFAFEESPHAKGTFWVGTDDGLVQLSRDGGKSWANVTPPDMPGEGATVNTIDISAHQPGRIFIAVHRYRMNDFRPYIFRTSDYGQTWDLLTDGIPADHFVRVVREDPGRKGLLYAGTEFGMFISFDDGNEWQPFQLDLPVTPVTDLVVHEKDLIASTQGRGLWILDDLTALHQMTDETASAAAYLFEPREAYRTAGGRAGPDVRITSSPLKGGRVPVHLAGENPHAGALIYYSFNEKPTQEVTLEILDAQNQVVRSFSSQSEDPEKKGELPVDAGLNRFVWNLRYPGLDVTPDTFVWGYTGGPTAVPGRYRVRMTLGDWSQTRDFEVKKDPRLDITIAEYQEQFDLMTAIRGELEKIQNALREIRSLREENPDDPRNEELRTIEEELMQLRNEYRMDPLNFPPKLMGQMAYLYREVRDSDGKPTVGARQRFEDLRPMVAAPLDRMKALLESR